MGCCEQRDEGCGRGGGRVCDYEGDSAAAALAECLVDTVVREGRDWEGLERPTGACEGKRAGMTAAGKMEGRAASTVSMEKGGFGRK